jgi:hypothetical protein
MRRRNNTVRENAGEKHEKREKDERRKNKTKKKKMRRGRTYNEIKRKR